MRIRKTDRERKKAENKSAGKRVTFHGVGKSGTITRGSHEPLFPPFMQAVPY